MPMAGDHPIPFLPWRDEWQKKKEESFFEMLGQIEGYAERTISFREKMRALYLFGNLTGYRRGKETSFTSLPERVFQSWFLFDYVNVRRERVVERVAKEWGKEEEDWEYVSSLIASYFSIFQVEKDHQRCYLTEWNDEIPRFSFSLADWADSARDSIYVLLRPVKIGVKFLPLMPVVPLRKHQAEEKIAWLKTRLAKSSFSGRIFMQREGMGLFRDLF
ncbi:MAG: hypothetical protein WBZ33_05975 [Thermoactinomyces sp.]